jgi:nitrogen-specific signal transduction histidine kinase
LPNDTIEVSVADNGPGIDATMAGKIFDQFQTSKKTGMGIGLSLSHSIAVNYGWMKAIRMVHYSSSNYLLVSEYMDRIQATPSKLSS